jgi:two-component system phosphate regulon sensor histidine kinase PhoR
MKSTNRIALLLALVFLLPALFFSVYEISSLNKNEEMVQDIYDKQLEALLFSANQYADDIVGNWISRIETGLQTGINEGEMPSKIQDLLTYNASLRTLIITDTINGIPRTKIFSLDSGQVFSPEKINETFSKNEALIRQLVAYKKSGFQKVSVLPDSFIQSGNLRYLVFITDISSQHFRVVGLLIDPEIFIRDVVGPKLQTIAKDQFVLSSQQKGFGRNIYSTARLDSLQTEAVTKEFWLFPDYNLGIRTKGTSLKKIAQERTTINLILLISLNVVLIIAVVLVFRNVKREVQLAQNKSDFVSNVSHEIRTPLALISMFAETLEMGRITSEEKKQEYYRIISKETLRLSSIVNKILNFSQTEGNKKTLTFEAIELTATLNEILNTYDFHLVNKGFTYSLNHPSETWVLADKEAFIECIINLIDNAIKYSSTNKKLEFFLSKDDEFGFVKIKDQGIGISKTDQQHIFDKFYRVSTGDLAKSRGTGLGLSLVKQLMEAQKGKITVYSEPGRGSTFTLFFPLDKA